MPAYDSERYEILSWVQEFHPAAFEDELPSNLLDFRNAKERDNCADKCPGLARCKTGGYIPRPVYANIYHRYVIAFAPCPQATTERTQDQIVKSVESAGIPERFVDATFENYETLGLEGNLAAGKSIAMECAERDLSLILGGAPGTGKTHLAVAMAKVQLAKGKSVAFVPVISLLEAIKNGFSEGNSAKIMNAMKTASFVVLDDLGAQRDSEWNTEYIFGLIDDRYRAKLATVITTNATDMTQLAKMAGAERGHQICGRMKESGHEHWMKGCKDYRNKARQNIIKFGG